MNSDCSKIEFSIDWGSHAILRMISAHNFDTVLDIGSGIGEHKRFFEYFGKQVFAVDINRRNADYFGDFMRIDLDKKFDAIWCSHVLEHQRNVGLFLDKVYDSLTDNGVLAIIVPIHPKERLISGHLTSWSIPLLCYNLVMAGFDCRTAELLNTYELSLIVRKRLADHPELRDTSAHGRRFTDLRQYFPFEVREGVEIENKLCAINWGGSPIKYLLPQPVSGNTNLKVDSTNYNKYEALRPKITYSDS